MDHSALNTEAMKMSAQRAKNMCLAVGDEISFAGVTVYRITDIFSDRCVMAVKIVENGHFVLGSTSYSLDLRSSNWALTTVSSHSGWRVVSSSIQTKL